MAHTPSRTLRPWLRAMLAAVAAFLAFGVLGRAATPASAAGNVATCTEAAFGVFARFERLSQTPQIAGIGIGLHLSRELARKMGGELALGPASGHGEFVLTLPGASASGGRDDAVPLVREGSANAA